jgi:hypothetical protein
MAGAFAIARWRRRFLFRYFFAGVTVYSGWELKDWSSVERLLADSFAFTSPVGAIPSRARRSATSRPDPSPRSG